MSNSLLNISMITKESLMELKNQIGFAGAVNRQYDERFAKSGAKIGDTCNIRKPVRFNTTSGKAINIQNVEDQSESLVLNNQEHVAFQFSSKELALNIDEFRDRYIKPAVTALANKIDLDGLVNAKTTVWNSVGTPGTQPATQAEALNLALSAGQKLDENGCPVDGERTMLVDPASQVAMVKGLAGLYNQQAAVGKQYAKGRMFDALGFKWSMDQNVSKHLTGVMGGAPAVATNPSTTSVTWDGGTSSSGVIAGVFKAGDVISFADVYAVNPQSGESTGSLMQFVVQAVANGDDSGTGTVTFLPALKATGPYKNVSKLPEDGDVITLFGHASSYANKTTPTNLAFHKDAFVLGMADLPRPGGTDMSDVASDPSSGLSIRIVRDYDINNDVFPCRLDVLYGWKTTYGELACRVHG